MKKIIELEEIIPEGGVGVASSQRGYDLLSLQMFLQPFPSGGLKVTMYAFVGALLCMNSYVSDKIARFIDLPAPKAAGVRLLARVLQAVGVQRLFLREYLATFPTLPGGA